MFSCPSFRSTWHSLKFVFDNARVAVWTFLPAFVVNVVWQLLLTAHYRYHAFYFFDAGSSRFPGSALTPYLPFLIGTFVLSIAVQLVIAVAWHRYVLTGERPWSQGVGVVLRRSGVGLATAGFMTLALFWVVLSSLTYAGLRFSPALPAVSIDGLKLGLRAS